MELNKDNVRFIYFGRNNDAKHQGILCVGYEVSEDRREVLLGASFCSPEDHFSKKKAHAIILGRMEKTPYTLELDKEITKEFEKATYEDIADLVRQMFNDSLPEKNIKEVVAAHNYKTFPKFLNIPIPWWAKPLEKEV